MAADIPENARCRAGAFSGKTSAQPDESVKAHIHGDLGAGLAADEPRQTARQLAFNGVRIS
jgi:hypothetical protein